MTWQEVCDTVFDWCRNTGLKIVIAIVVFIVSFSLINFFMKRLSKRLEKNKKADKTISRALVYVLKIVLKIIVIAALVGYLGFDTSGLTALIASLGVAIGLAVNGALSNFAGGVMIIITRPFKDDDYISACGYEGTVEAIKITHTKIRTVDNKTIYLPNGQLSTSSIVNYSEKPTRRVDQNFSISYSEDFERAENIIREIVNGYDLALKDPAPAVGIASHSDSAIVLFTKVWCKTEDYWTVYNYLLEEVKRQFDLQGVEIPFNQLDVHIKNS